LKNKHTYFLLAFLVCSLWLYSQERPVNLPGRGGGRAPGGIPGSIGSRFSQGISGGQGMDSLQRRDKFEDSITIYYQLPSSVQSNKLDSSVSDYTKRFPIPAHYLYLGNTGTAGRSILFSPTMQSGWDHGFHSFDIYKWKPENVRFFNTTRPYTELGYLLGGRTEQIIEITHTQNIRPNWNGLFQYRLINAPGFFKNQKTNHNNYLLTSWYQSVNKRYNNYFTILANSIQSDESGGIQDDKDYLSNPLYDDRFQIPVKIGGDPSFSRNFFSTALTTGNRNRDFTFMLRQQYDFGKKDSLVSDSTVIPLFYPRLRFEHTFRYSTHKLIFMDNVGDSVYYKATYGLTLPNPFDTVFRRDAWKEMVNDFSIFQFPDAKNQLQFIKAGIAVQNLRGEFTGLSKSFYNVSVHGEYRNKTRNRKWDMAAAGILYLNGLNAGDYHAAVNLKRFAGRRDAYIELGFRNTNRTPSYVFDGRSSFYLDAVKDFKKENITHLSASVYQPKLGLKISGNYYLVGNYTYFTDFYKPLQQEALFNLLQIAVEKKFRIGKSWVWYADVYFQQKTGTAPVNVPLIFTRNRFGYEGNLGFKNLNIAIGLEVKYHTPYKADGYSPLLANFYFQDSIRISNRPDIAAFIHFRIRNFRLLFRAENLNAMSTDENGFGFRNNNIAAPGYPYPGLNFRLGILWNFVN
jgi:hypothetical protein